MIRVALEPKSSNEEPLIRSNNFTCNIAYKVRRSILASNQKFRLSSISNNENIKAKNNKSIILIHEIKYIDLRD